MKTPTKLTIFLLLVLLSGCASTALFVVNNMARFGDYTVYQNLQYGKTSAQGLDLYLPDNTSELNHKNTPTVVFFYGGCWGACSDLVKEDYRFVAQTLATNDIIVAVVDYRKFPEYIFPQIMDDARQSVEWVAANIEKYGGNKNTIYLMGHSAGAHMASMLNFNEKYLDKNTYKKVKGFIGLAGPYDFLPFDEWYQPALFAPPESYATSQTVNYVDGTEPPVLLLYGNSDTRVKRRNILSLSKKINDKNGSVETHYYDDIGHADIVGSLSIPFRSNTPVLADILKFIHNKSHKP